MQQNSKKIHPLKKARAKLNYTQTMLADFSLVSEATIQRAENGKPLRPDSIQRICDHISERYQRAVKPEELGLIYEETEAQPDYSPEQASSLLIKNLLENQEFLSKVKQAIFQDILNMPNKVLISPSDTLHSTKQHSASLNEERVAFFESMMSTQWITYHTGGTDKVIPGLNLFLREIETVVQIAQGTSWHNRALRLLALGYQLQNCVFRDLSNFAQASIAYQKAFEVAQELEDEELLASALARQGVVLVQQARAKQAILYLDNALNIIADRNLPKLKGYTLQALSEANAQEQHMRESWSCIEQVENIAISPFEEEQSLIRFHSSSVIAQKGIDAVFLRDFKTAIDLINQSLKTYYPTGIKGRARLTALKAEAYYSLGVIDASILSAKEALTLAQSVGSNKIIVRIKNLYTELQQSKWKEENDVAHLGTMLYSASTKLE
ncbi:MAG TPA: helix-turn-helix transcriptional regulator [Ktedonobacteraceae bacterium]|nr:helix-turn-helix transcriptional regulator [Ktedonobacteraceae bacterium]